MFDNKVNKFLIIGHNVRAVHDKISKPGFPGLRESVSKVVEFFLI